MPQMDSAAFLPQVFWLIVVFGMFYLIVKKNILPVLTRILKVRTKKLSQGESLLLRIQSEADATLQSYELALGSNLKNSSNILQQLGGNSTAWVEQEASYKTGKGTTDKNITSMNSKYLETAANLAGKKNLLLPVLKGS